MIGLPSAHNESHERFSWQHFDLLTKGKQNVGCDYSWYDVTHRFSLGLVVFMHVGFISLNENVILKT